MIAAGTQPITLITATPGGGKTALAVKLMKEAHEQGRPLFVSGIPDLKLPHEECPPIAEWTEIRRDPNNPDVEMAYFTFPENALIVLDEAQRIYRPRSSASKVPPHVAAFETVRHTGVTFILITQNPMLIDSNIRALVGQHIHLRDIGVFGRQYYEWPECSRPETYATAPIKKKFKIPKDVFPLYTSSSMHIKRKYNIPPALIMIVGCLLLAAGAVAFMYHRLAPKEKPAIAKVNKNAAPGAPAVNNGVNNFVPPGGPLGKNATAADMIAAEIPVRPGHPESAPMYAGMLHVTDVPKIAGAMKVGSKYTCYTQQGTDAGLDNEQCRKWMEKRPFDPYKAPGNDAPVNSVQAVSLPVNNHIDAGPVGEYAPGQKKS